ncbi:MAG: hypothetical protein ACI32N_06930 [Bulleidia sp.]
MIYIFFSALILAILSEGTGQMFLHLLHLETDDFASPIGTAVIFCILEMLYTPVMLCQGAFSRIALVSTLVLIITLLCFVLRVKQCLKSLLRGRMIYVLLSSLLFMGIFACCEGKLQPQLNDELNLMASNLNASSISLGDSPLQGYSLFGSFVMGLCQADALNTTLLMGVYANMITCMLLLDIVDSFRIGNPWFRFTLILGSVFYYPFYSWKIVGAFNSGNWRVFFIAMVLYYLYQWIASKKDPLKYVAVISIGAGLFVHRGFLMIGIEIIYCLAAWMLCTKRIRSLYDISTFLAPVIIYLCIRNMMTRFWIGFICLIVYVLFLVFRSHRRIYHNLILVENLLMEHSHMLFYVLVPAIFLLGTFILRFFVKGYGFEYSGYLDYFSSSYLNSYLFLSHYWPDLILDCFRWIGLFIFLFRAFRDEEKMIQHVFLGMVVFFINPLCMGLLSRITGYQTYAYAFEILLNPFTDVMIFYWIYTQFEWTVVGQWVLELTLVGCLLFGHISSFTGMEHSLYGELLDAEKIVEINLP